MVLSIKTDIPALISTRHFNRTEEGISTSIGRLSSGLRINKAADDSSGMVIADSLTSQALGLGQAIRNANDAISIVQVADAALEESINILNTIKVKSIQAAQDGKTLESRKAIQSDIQHLIQELDNIAKTTSFNGQKLLSGGFSDKSFQIGAYSGEKIGLSIGSATAGKIGHMTTGDIVVHDGGEGIAYLGIKGSKSQNIHEIQPVELTYDNSPEHGMGALADAVNKMSEITGVRVTASVETAMDGSIQPGMTDTDFSINRVKLGSFSVVSNDADGSLIKAINNKTVLHGVNASVNDNGGLVLTSVDGRGIWVEPEPGRGTGIDAIFKGKNLTTLGKLTVQGSGAGMFEVRDLGGGRTRGPIRYRAEYQNRCPGRAGFNFNRRIRPDKKFCFEFTLDGRSDAFRGSFSRGHSH